MAIYKPVRQDDGVTTNYHRVLFLMHTVNRQNSIAVLSYVDEEARDGARNNMIMQPYSKSITYEVDYDPNMTIDDAYAYLKTLPQYEGAVDV